MTWFILSVFAGCIGAAVWAARVMLRLGDSQRERMLREVAEDAAEKNKRQAEIFAEPSGDLKSILEKMRDNRDNRA